MGFAFVALAFVASAAPAPVPGLCEASGVVVVGDGVLVADDEERAALARFRVAGDTLVPDGSVAIATGGRPRDVEALAAFPDGRIALVGSHGRSRKGAAKKRARVLVVTVHGDTTTRVSGVDHGAALEGARGDVARCGALFVEGARAAAPALCPRLDLDVEGALVDRGGRLWLGLRRPLVDGRAVLLRLRLDGPGFDRATFVALGGRGVRDLAPLDERVLVLAGPSDDKRAPGALYLADAAALAGGGKVEARLTTPAIPAGAEAVAVIGDRVLVLTDGARDGDRCPTPATAVFVPRATLLAAPAPARE